jgi:hypothetical protein
MEVLKQLVGVKKEIITYENCTFHVYRKSKRDKIFTTTLWRKSVGYVFNLSNSLLWWARKFPELFQDWNIRVYFDSYVFKGVHGDPTDWIGVFNNILRYSNDNVELWFYQCEFPHKNTFGSLVRFHAFDDPTTKVVVSHNLEFLTSPKDRERINLWLESGKKYHMYTSVNHSYIYGCVSYPIVCEANGLYGIPSLMATFGMAKRDGEVVGIFRYGLEIARQKKRKLRDFPYGVDEIVLTDKLRGDIDHSNTFVSNIILEYDYIPLFINKWMVKIASELGMFTPDILRRFGTGHGRWYYLSYILSKDIDKGVEYIIKGKKWIERECELKNVDLQKICDLIEEKMQEYLIIAFKGRSVVMTADIYIQIERAINIRSNVSNYLLFAYHMFKTNLFYCIDFPGSCIKKKDFAEKKSEQDEDDDEDDDNDYKQIFSKTVQRVYLS